MEHCWGRRFTAGKAVQTVFESRTRVLSAPLRLPSVPSPAITYAGRSHIRPARKPVWPFRRLRIVLGQLYSEKTPRKVGVAPHRAPFVYRQRSPRLDALSLSCLWAICGGTPDLKRGTAERDRLSGRRGSFP